MSSENSRLKFYCDDDRCIECYACSVACSQAHELPTGINRRKVITMNEGLIGLEYSLSIACMHCTDAPCEQVCPVDCFYIREDGIVLHDKETCIGCGYCLYACPFGAPQFPQDGAFGTKGAMDKCTMCAGGPEETNSHKEKELYGQNRIAEGKVPLCAAVCSTNALLVGDSQKISEVIRQRVLSRGHNHQSSPAGWSMAYGS
ncbi:MAG: formate dehydrogenase FDH3 subunit beta [Campylobacterales bacterium]|nr:formate dehydrogenase FDH3 subunit beta [Campylobacterales bacterium]NQY21584.1 4Fe-4S dicluster domain-containing protein [Campylobacteraceae bacterium]NQY53828.1 4Fe-4S dicluster domain-containing protein [Campylobacteraceae bacterium]